MLIDKNGETHEYSFPGGHGFTQLVFAPEHENDVRNEHNHKGHERYKVRCDPFGSELEKELSERRPEVLIGETGRAALVFEVLEVDLL